MDEMKEDTIPADVLKEIELDVDRYRFSRLRRARKKYTAEAVAREAEKSKRDSLLKSDDGIAKLIALSKAGRSFKSIGDEFNLRPEDVSCAIRNFILDEIPYSDDEAGPWYECLFLRSVKKQIEFFESYRARQPALRPVSEFVDTLPMTSTPALDILLRGGRFDA